MTATVTALVPVWNQGDRIGKSMREAGISVGALARYLEVNRNTIGNWANGHTKPSVASLRMIAMLTGVDFDWLKDGTAPADDAAGAVVRHQGLEPRTRWLRASGPFLVTARGDYRSTRRTLERVAA